ncbi:hypothetical protein ACS0TY_010050 [Phlomoides rotata]
MAALESWRRRESPTHAKTKPPNQSRKSVHYDDGGVRKSEVGKSKETLVGANGPILGPTDNLDLNQPCWAGSEGKINPSIVFDCGAQGRGQGDSISMSETISETSAKHSRDSPENWMESSDEGEDSDEEAWSSKRKKTIQQEQRSSYQSGRTEMVMETKVEEVNKRLCKSIWGNSPSDWAWLGSIGNVGGILTIWNSEVFQKTSEWSRTGMLVVNGRWVEDDSMCTIVNGYAPAQRGDLWEILQALVRQATTERICIVGDFNTIREESERVGRATSCDRNEMARFNSFIDGCDLMEVQLVGRRYTWYRPDGTCKSKLDRLLVNSNWLNKWPDVMLKGGKRSLSDHVPIYIEGCKKDWGPRPFKFFNQWIQHPTYKGVIDRVWSTSNIQGWAGFVIKEKLKELKLELKKWS